MLGRDALVNGSKAASSATYAEAHQQGAGANATQRVYATSANIRDRPYEGEMTIAAILHMEEIVPRVLSFMSAVELLYTQTVSHSWHRHSCTARRSLIHRLHLGQFWSRIGVAPTEHFIRIASSFGAVTEVNLAYCSFMTGPVFSTILHAVPNFERITKLNLFYSYQLVDNDIEALVSENALPQLRELNLGRVSKLTDRSVRALAELRHLTYLNLVHNQKITEETLMLFDDLTKFPMLQIFNITHTKFRTEDIEELSRACQTNGRNAQLHRIGGANIRFIGPNELFQVDKSGKKMRKDYDADT